MPILDDSLLTSELQVIVFALLLNAVWLDHPDLPTAVRIIPRLRDANISFGHNCLVSWSKEGCF